MPLSIKQALAQIKIIARFLSTTSTWYIPLLFLNLQTCLHSGSFPFMKVLLFLILALNQNFLFWQGCDGWPTSMHRGAIVSHVQTSSLNKHQVWMSCHQRQMESDTGKWVPFNYSFRSLKPCSRTGLSHKSDVFFRHVAMETSCVMSYTSKCIMTFKNI